MMMFGGGMALLMPKLMQNLGTHFSRFFLMKKHQHFDSRLDPEALEEMKAQQAEMAKNNPFTQIQDTDMSEKLTNFFGGSSKKA